MTRAVPDDLTCQELVDLLTAYLDDALDPQSRRAVDGHLADCPGCQRALSHLRLSARAVRATEVEALDPAVRENLLMAFRRRFT